MAKAGESKTATKKVGSLMPRKYDNPLAQQLYELDRALMHSMQDEHLFGDSKIGLNTYGLDIVHKIWQRVATIPCECLDKKTDAKSCRCLFCGGLLPKKK